jgi:hypothetical protein
MKWKILRYEKPAGQNTTVVVVEHCERDNATRLVNDANAGNKIMKYAAVPQNASIVEPSNWQKFPSFRLYRIS